ncbi:uncharacterized protein PGTG_22680 [Puccinia graminis f. sp. tritici CRL 75-36-700-3]|uniref:Uncharacterized protein n=1 Tax=Puccinia graminis f. sp. tritici (strain CRL 75-36-700-3 / race SCCL) TaxID=418459 RepID=H6QV79_PUCGT|nr:uncharacterized protein PGTG_22680 [Puccinia graminis f. sp. tritici CRL 75-36-700-3]EHS62780.1 hypothetical protein PGTG_22680 [Puccinia graminis f. sp. tritici CRL 75-36-700-3]
MPLVLMAFAGGLIQQLRTYLTRGDLPGNPMADSAWAYMFSGQKNRAFITTMCVDVATFNNLLKPFADRFTSERIPRANVNPQGKPQLGRQSLNAARCLGLVLH